MPHLGEAVKFEIGAIRHPDLETVARWFCLQIRLTGAYEGQVRDGAGKSHWIIRVQGRDEPLIVAEEGIQQKSGEVNESC